MEEAALEAARQRVTAAEEQFNAAAALLRKARSQVASSRKELQDAKDHLEMLQQQSHRNEMHHPDDAVPLIPAVTSTPLGKAGSLNEEDEAARDAATINSRSNNNQENEVSDDSVLGCGTNLRMDERDKSSSTGDGDEAVRNVATIDSRSNEVLDNIILDYNATKPKNDEASKSNITGDADEAVRNLATIDSRSNNDVSKESILPYAKKSPEDEKDKSKGTGEVRSHNGSQVANEDSSTAEMSPVDELDQGAKVKNRDNYLPNETYQTDPVNKAMHEHATTKTHTPEPGNDHFTILSLDEVSSSPDKRIGSYNENGTVEVTNCGIPAINGRYRRFGEQDGVPSYSKVANYEGREVMFTLGRWETNNGSRKWYITGTVPNDDRPRQLAFYVAYARPRFQRLPPENGWMAVVRGSEMFLAPEYQERGVRPPPVVNVNEAKYNMDGSASSAGGSNQQSLALRISNALRSGASSGASPRGRISLANDDYSSTLSPGNKQQHHHGWNSDRLSVHSLGSISTKSKHESEVPYSVYLPQSLLLSTLDEMQFNR
mmetsp:Transcript_33823/g.57443  ORF Transcript_33823/g.57443 Transcript_33823/m.57443 type:complete len:546 (+) Transcript_33823:342-1979(+)